MIESAHRQPAATSSRAGPTAPRGRRPKVVIDLEKLRHINCGLGRFSYYLGRELLHLADAPV